MLRVAPTARTTPDDVVEPERDAGRAAPRGPRLLTRHPDLALLALLVAVAAVPRLMLQLQAPIFLSTDSSEYVRPAYDLVNGQGLTTRLKRPNGYPLMLGAVFAVAGPDLMAAAAVQHVLGIVTVGLTYLLGRVCFNRAVGFGAALLVAVSGPQLTWEQTLLSESICTLLLVVLALALILATRATTHRPALVAGLLLGLTAVVKPVAQSLLPCALAFAALRPGSGRRRLASTGVLAAAFVLVVAPWTFRNLAVHGSLSLGGGLGESLLDSTADYSRGIFLFDGPGLPPEPDATRAAGRRIVQQAIESRRGERRILEQLRAELGLGENEADRLARDLALEVIGRQPLDFLGRIPVFIRVLYGGGQNSNPLRWDSYKLWQGDRVLNRLVRSPTNAQEAGRPRVEALLSLYQPSRLGLALPLLALAGLIAAGRLRPWAPALVPGLLALAWVLIHVTLDGPPARYRYPVEPFVNVLALGAVWLGVGYAARWWRRATGEARSTRAERG